MMKLTGCDRIFKDALLRGTGRCFAMLATDDTLTECLHDASVDIRDYAKRFLSRRRAKATSNPVNPVNPV